MFYKSSLNNSSESCTSSLFCRSFINAINGSLLLSERGSGSSNGQQRDQAH